MDADVIIVGGGAAGLACAIFAKEHEPTKRIMVVDGATKLGAKILVSGGGRCNVTNREVREKDYQGEPRFIRHVLKAFDAKAGARWFESLGVELKTEEDTGKVFPVSDQARSILDALLARCKALGVEIRQGYRIDHVTVTNTDAAGFQLESGSHEPLRCSSLVLATGGRSLPKSGSDGGGWELARSMGHQVTTTIPALVPLKLEEGFFHADVSGIALEAELRTLVEGRCIDRRTGSLLWTHFGISGPVAMDVSRFITQAQHDAASVQLLCNLLPDWDFSAADRWWQEQASANPRRSVSAALAKKLPKRLAEALCASSGVPIELRLCELSRERRRSLCKAITELKLPIEGHRGWNYAEVTGGGIPLSEVDSRTMASKLQPQLYFIGEILDCDGRIGGFNFHWAWSTGFIAGRAIASGH